METQEVPDDDIEFPPLIFEEEPPRSAPPPVSDAQEIERAFDIVRAHHERIATALHSIWGYQECADYLEKLVFNCSDPADLTRAGFNPEVVDALLILSRLHKVVAA